MQVKVPLKDNCIDEPVKLFYAQGAVKVVGSIFQASTVASAAMKVVMPPVSELTDDISVCRECPVLTWIAANLFSTSNGVCVYNRVLYAIVHMHAHLVPAAVVLILQWDDLPFALLLFRVCWPGAALTVMVPDLRPGSV